jgi:hypothetical protein
MITGGNDMRTRLLFVLALTAFSVCAIAAENNAEVNGSPKIAPPVNRENPEIKPLEPFNSHGLELTFALEATQFAPGERIRGDVTLKCVGNEGFAIFNPFFHRGQWRPGDVRVFDSAGKLVSKLLEVLFNYAYSLVDDQITVYPGDSVGTQINEKPRGLDWHDLAPGKYTAQFVLFSHIVHGHALAANVNPCPPGCGYTYEEFVAGKAVIAAAKPMPFEIVAKNSSGASTSPPAAH